MRLTINSAPDWGFWLNVPEVWVWEAVALSLDIDPRSLSIALGAGSRFLQGLPPERQKEFARRHELTNRNLGATLYVTNWREHSRGADPKIRLARFVEWARSLPWELPVELSDDRLKNGATPADLRDQPADRKTASSMRLPISGSLSLAEARGFVVEATGENERRVMDALVETGITGAINAIGRLHSSAHPNLAQYFAHPVLTDRRVVPPSAWSGPIDWQLSRVGRYDLVRIDRAEIERWLAAPEAEASALAVSTGERQPEITEVGASVPPSGIRTNREEDAEHECNLFLRGLTVRPENKDAAFKAARLHCGEHLSRKAFDRSWPRSVPAAWKKGGRREKAQKS